MKRFLLVVFALAVVLLTGCGTSVPDVKGLTADAATKSIKAAGFEVGRIAYDEQSAGAPGAVVSQKPEAGDRADAGSMIVLTVAGAPPVKTPDLSGLDRAGAEAAIKAVGLTVGQVLESYDSSAQVGFLISQDPARDAVAAKGAPVGLVFSKGPEPIDVPNVKGGSVSKGTSELEAAGFKVKVHKEHDSAKKGSIIAQKPGKGRAIPGSTVVVTVSEGPELVRVPNIHGMMDPDPLLRRKGLRPRSIAIHGPIESDAAGFGEAYRQRPAAGSLVPKGTTVSYHFWWESE